MFRDLATEVKYRSRFEYSVHKAYAFFDSEFPANPLYKLFLPFVIFGNYIDSFTKEFGIEKIKK